MKLNKVIKTVLLLILLCQPVFAQSNKLSRNRQDLDKIRADIELYKNRIQSESVKEKSYLDMLSALDREIDLTHSLLEQLQQEEEKNSAAILEVAHELKMSRLELDRIQEAYKQRLIYFYKYGRLKDIELLFSTKSFNQVLTWIKYQKLLAANDRRNYQSILEKKNIVESKKDNLKSELITKRKIIREKTEEEDKLNERKTERKKLLATVRQNKQLYFQKLKDYEISAKEIERLISAREETRLSAGIYQQTDFPKLKGRLIWPTQGPIMTKYGKYKHPELKTITENIGIDIKANFGDDVRAVGDGVVTAITWQRGRGNIVIVNHFGGYYTVYTHLSKILVQIDEAVKLGQVIGEVGDSGSLRGPVLHFEIWQNNKVQNPEDWLS